jgi:ribosome-associated toxin RatA of RatAB toxin-antitoxin module
MAAGTQQSGAVRVERQRLIAATPERIFALIADVENLAAILPRVRRVEVLARGENQACVRTHMAIGPIGSFSSEGQACWVANRELTFSTSQPATMETHWTLTPTDAGTLLCVVMVLDLRPMIGPLANFVPADSVSAMIAPDLEATLSAIAERMAG